MESVRDYFRFCPGEEAIKISNAVCRGRRHASYPKCHGCQFNDDERQAARTAPNRADPPMSIESVFKAYDIRGIYPSPLSEEAAWRIGHATAQYLLGQLRGHERVGPNARTVVVGRDMRTHSPILQHELIEGLRAAGMDVINIGMIDTSQVYFAVNHFGACGGIQTTASHNPAQYNGFKICGVRGTPIGIDTGLSSIRDIAARIPKHQTGTTARLTDQDLAKPYREFLLQFLRGRDKLPRPLKVVIDAGNGMAGRWFPIVFGGVKGLSIIPLYFEHDGRFVHDPNPLVAANLKDLRKAVKDAGADFGACFDGDADRCIFVDEKAAIVSCDMITALLARTFLDRHPGAAVVYDLRSSRVVAEEIERAGGKPVRERVGHAFMKKTMAEHDALFGGELSGHFYFRDNYYCDSGLLAFIHVVNVLAETGRRLGDLIRPLQRYRASGEINFQCPDKDRVLRELLKTFADAQVDQLDGVTVQYPDWWFNVRPSNTEPLLRLNLEARTKKMMEERLAELAPLLGTRVEH